MRYRVLKHDEHSYEVQGKGLFFWSSCHEAASLFGPTPRKPMFMTLDDARAWIDTQRKEPEIVFDEGVDT